MFYTHGLFSVRRHGVVAAFTLLEVLVTVTIVIALCAISLRATHRASQASRVARARSELAVLSVALEEYRRVCGDYPRTNDPARLLQSLVGRRGPRNEVIGLRSFVELTRFTVEEAKEPFSDDTAVLVDSWGRAYRYAYKTQSPWDNPDFILYSVGSDGVDSAGLIAGGYPNPSPTENADNLYAALTR